MPQRQNRGGRERPPLKGVSIGTSRSEVFHASTRPPGGSLPSHLSLREGSEKDRNGGAHAPERGLMKWRHPILLFVGLCWSVWGFLYSGFALSAERSLEKSFP